MLQAIDIQNFQSHKHTNIQFDPGVNVIIGPSDSGKTAILRALRWVKFNRPLGDAYRSTWGGETVVTLDFDDCSVERFKDKKDFYRVHYDPPLEPLEFTAFGTEPPEEVVDALNMTELNIQNQMDSPFLISSNPGEVSRHFNKIARIDKIDTSLTNIESWVRSLRESIKAAEADIERHNEDLESFAYLDKMEADVEVLETLETNKTGLATKHVNLINLVNHIETVEQDIITKSKLLPLEDPVGDLLSLYEERRQARIDYKKLKAVALELHEVQQGIVHNEALLEDEDVVVDLLSLYNEKEQAQKEVNKLESKIYAIEAANNNIEKAKTKLQKLEDRWHEEMPEVCPLCGK